MKTLIIYGIAGIAIIGFAEVAFLFKQWPIAFIAGYTAACIKCTALLVAAKHH